jgi:hypothetical protein
MAVGPAMAPAILATVREWKQMSAVNAAKNLTRTRYADL